MALKFPIKIIGYYSAYAGILLIFWYYLTRFLKLDKTILKTDISAKSFLIIACIFASVIIGFFIVIWFGGWKLLM
jgi:hypothetical protein